MAEKKEKQYVSDNALLIAEWNRPKNADIIPSQVTLGSDKKVWWICGRGHEWQATIESRSGGCGCPYCAGTLVSKGENDLQTVNPVLAEEWDADKNDGLTPADVLPNSHKKVWWRCRSGHVWQASVAKRSQGQNCPFCYGNKVKKGYNDLATTNPELISEWDTVKNDLPIYAYRPMSNKKVWWICDKGHSWAAVIAKRANGEKCPICRGKQILRGFNDLATTHPTLAQEWCYEENSEITPADVSKGCTKKVWWRCNRNHIWQAAVYSRVSGVGCPHCAKAVQTSFPEKAIFFYVKKIFPDAIANYHSNQINAFELDVFIPSFQIGIEYDGERWHQVIENDLRKNDLLSKIGISLIRIREPACPIILDNRSINIIRENKKTGLENAISQLLDVIFKATNVSYTIDVDLERDGTAILELLDPIKKENSVHTQSTVLLSEWDYQKNGSLDPNMITVGSDKKVWWICHLGHSYFASVSSRSRGRGCPICAGKKILIGYNDLKTLNPDLAREWHYGKNEPITPADVTCGSGKRVWWICGRGHEWQATIYNRNNGSGCPQCAKEKRMNPRSQNEPPIAEK